MKTQIRVVAMLLFCSCGGRLAAQSPADDAVQSLLFSPEVLIRHRDQIGLSDGQVEQIRQRVEEAGSAMREHEARLKLAMSRLVQELSAERVDEQKALEQLDQVLGAEKELKHLHMRLLIQIRNDLTAEQRRAAGGIRQEPAPAREIEQRLQAKITRIEKEVQARAQAGEPPVEVIGFMQKLPELMQKGQVRDAEALLDRVLGMLGSDRPKKKPESPPADRGANRPRSESRKRTETELVAHVAGLRQEKVAWREIAWKPCLIDGLTASREQKKPILLWIFIDRPLDDERC